MPTPEAGDKSKTTAGRPSRGRADACKPKLARRRSAWLGAGGVFGIHALSQVKRSLALLIAITMALVCFAVTASAQARPRSLSGEVGIWYFYLSTCPYCMRQEPILAAVAKRYGISVTPISLDGGPPPGHIYTAYMSDRGQAAQLGVRATPTLYLVHPSSREVAQLTTGFVSVQQLMQRIAQVIDAAGWASENVPGRISKDDPILKRLNALKGGPRW